MKIPQLPGNRSRRFGMLGVLLLMAVPLWRWGIAPQLEKLPGDFHYEAQVFSRDDLYDEESRRFRGEEVSRTKFSYDVVSKKGEVFLVKNIFDVRTITGDRIFDVERMYGVDSRTGRHVKGYGDRDREGYLFAPRWAGNTPYTYWHVNYDAPAHLVFQGAEKISGLTVHRYACDYKADQTRDLGRLPGVGKTRGIGLDVHLEVWIEPVSGWLVKYADDTLAYYYDLKTKERLLPWNKFRNTYAESSVARQVDRARAQKLKILLIDAVIPALLLSGAALCFLLWAEALFSLGMGRALRSFLKWIGTRAPWMRHPYWSPAALSLAVWVLIAIFARLLASRENTQINNAVTVEADRISNRMAVAMEHRVLVLGRLASLWESTSGRDRKGWEAAAREYSRDFPGFQAIEWVDPNYRVQWIEPLKKNETAQGFDLSSEKKRRQALQAAQKSREAAVTQPLELKQGGMGFLIFQPLYERGRFRGFILGAFRYDKLLNSLLEPAAEVGHSVVVFDKDQEIFSRGEIQAPDAIWSPEINVPVRGLSWRIKIRPAPAWSPLLESHLPQAVLILGSFLSVLMGCLLYLTNNARVQAAALSLRTADLEAFSYTVSHDLRAPLRAVQGYAHFLQKRDWHSPDPESRRLLERISDSTIRMDRLIQDLLVFGRLSREDYRMYAVDLDPIVAYVLGQYSGFEGVSVTVKGPLGRVIGQDTLLTQAISNLLVNATKFVSKDRPPRIEIRTENVVFERSRLTVEDNGIGIAEEFKARLFQPFQRLHTRGEFEGTGIGLAIVKRAVERMGGTVGFDSQIGKGSLFWIELPQAS